MGNLEKRGGEERDGRQRKKRENKKSNGVFFFFFFLSLSSRTKLSFRIKLVGFKMFWT